MKVREQQDPIEEPRPAVVVDAEGKPKTQQDDSKGKDGKEPKELTPKIVRMKALLDSRYEFRRNVIRQKLEWRDYEQGEEWHEMDDISEADIVFWLKEKGYTKPENDMATILKSSRVLNYNPVKEYVGNLKMKRLSQLKKLMDAVILDPNFDSNVPGVSMRSLFEKYFTKWLMACYKCMTGEKFNDVMLLLIGAQGRHKTSFLNFLCPAGLTEYRHTGHIEPTLNNYLTSSYLVEKVWVNVDDQMENIFGKDYNSMKSIISQDKVSRRLLYAKHSIQQTRIANFCGSVNEANFLRDSNNRRYLCFAIEDIDTSYSEVDIDSLWAEVKELADAAPSKYIFTQEDFRIIDLMDDNFASQVAENELLRNCFEPTDQDEQWTYYMQFNEIMKVLKKVGENGNLKEYNLQTAMRKYGYQVKSIRRPERGKEARKLYMVKISNGSQYRDQLITMCKNYRFPAEWADRPGAEPETDGCPF